LESATVVVRGGSGAGKTLMGIHVALELARALHGDVVVGCVEILPTEYVAQLESARPSLDSERIAMLHEQATPTGRPRVYVGLLNELDPETPDLVAGLEMLAETVTAAGGKPSVFVIDSLIEGYGIGASAPRTAADAVMKLAAQRGCAIVLCEESIGDEPSPWVFAADSVLQLGVESRERGRWIEVRKHRFGPSASGRHELDIVGSVHPEVFPAPHAWITKAIEPTLRAHGWMFGDGENIAELAMQSSLSWESKNFRALFVFVSAGATDVARGLANALHVRQKPRGRTLHLELDPLARDVRAASGESTDVQRIPTTHGPSRALRWMIEKVGSSRGGSDSGPDRILVGDTGLVLGGPDREGWSAAIHAFASIVASTRWGLPLIAYDGQAHGRSHRAHLEAQADIAITAVDHPHTRGNILATFAQRWPRVTESHGWPRLEITRSQSTLDS
jgi:KaiC/GvpD/RAD55 family RecA-like ATPase